MTDILKEKIIIRAIKIYKNREEWTDDYVQENYADAIPHAFAYVGDTGELRFDVKDANALLYGSFSYPVAES